MHPSVVLYDYARSFVGLPYKWGGNDALEGFDCSGLCLELLQSCGVFDRGVDLSAQGLWDKLPPPAKEAKYGCLAFYGNSEKEITHVAFCLNDLSMIEAGGGDSKTVNREIAAKQNAVVRIRPILSRKDLVGFKYPPYPWKG